MQFTNHLSAGLCPDLLGELTELGWLDPLAECGAPREREEEGTRMGGGEVEGKEDKDREAEYRERGRKKGGSWLVENRSMLVVVKWTFDELYYFVIIIFLLLFIVISYVPFMTVT